MHSYSEDPSLIIEPSYYSNGVPVFTPSYSQFHNFYQFNKAINKYGMKSGIAKVIPPPQWKNQLTHSNCYNHDNLEQNITIRNPIVQHINQISPGVYQQENIEKQRKYSIFQWKQLSEQQNFQPPRPRKRSREEEGAEKQEEQEEPSSPRKLRHGGGSDYNINIREFTDERCQELERNYWKTLTYAEPMYGADMIGSIFPSNIKSWNVANLPNILDLMDGKIPGVNDAYLYAGLWKATFAWHLEDQDLYSINYLHFGAPKQWYSIPQSEHTKFFNLMKDIFQDEYKHCSEFLRHKTFLVSPQILEKYGIKVNHIIHRQGEFMITYPYGYHAGFNYGYNLAESVNFALDDWFPLGRVSKKCECISDAVTINIKQLWKKYSGTEEEEEQEEEPEQQPEKEVKEKVVISKTISKPTKPKQNGHRATAAPPPRQCYLCPNRFPDTSPLFDLLSTEDPNIKIHRICANIFSNQLTLSNNIVTNLNSISKQQKQLKCMICHQSNLGACIQCSHQKCTRAFHPSCGLAGGVQFNGNEVYCKYHRTNEKHEKLGNLVQFNLNGKFYFGKIVGENINECIFNVNVLPGLYDSIEVSYDNVLWCDYNENMNYLINKTEEMNGDSSRTRSGKVYEK
ncbi:DNA damage-responsive transcriptional repressor RPH1 [Spathaspora sp. JA1]|nr:DNA damage-responsive transcriptional repressor RPH1 [Spathaspora sp. JA1]